MMPKTTQKPLSGRKRLFAKLRYQDKLKDEEIATECGIHRRRIYEWDKEPEVIAEMEKLGKADTEKAQRILERASVKAARKLEDLAEEEILDPQLAETGRKAACDILGAVNVTTKTLEGKGFAVTVISHIPGE